MFYKSFRVNHWKNFAVSLFQCQDLFFNFFNRSCRIFQKIKAKKDSPGMLSVQIAVHMMVFTTWQTIRNCPAGQDGADVVEPVNRYIANNIYTVLSTVQLVRTALMWWSRSTGIANNIYTVLSSWSGRRWCGRAGQQVKQTIYIQYIQV